MEVCDLGPALCALWRHGMTVGDIYHTAIAEALTASCRMDEILSSHKDSVKLPYLVGIEFTQQTFKYLQQQLIVHNYQGNKLFNITFKHHALAHCGIRGQAMNPRLSWCYTAIGLDEVRSEDWGPLHPRHALTEFVRAMEYSYDTL